MAAIEGIIDADPVLRAGAHLAGPKILAHSLPPTSLADIPAAIDITFSREGRAGSRIIRMRATIENQHSDRPD
jgi:hypothetical protein